MTSVPPLSSHSLNEPPPWYDGDNPTVPNPVYRDSGDEERAAAPAGPSSGATEEPPKKKDDVGRRGNMVMGAMLVAGMVVVGAAFAMVSGGSDTPGDTADNQVAADSAGSADQALAVASPGDAGGDDGGQDGAAEDADETESGDGSSEAGALPEPTAFGETVRVLDGVTVSTSETRAFDPVTPPDVPVSGYLAVDVTVVNGASEDMRVLPVVHLVDELEGIRPYLDGADLDETGHPQVVDESIDLAGSWSGADMELGSTAYGTFGFGLESSSETSDPYLVVWVDGGDGTPVPVPFGGP